MKLKRTIATALVLTGVLSGCSKFAPNPSVNTTTASTVTADTKTIKTQTIKAGDKAPAGTTLGDLDLSGLTKAEALKKAAEFKDKLNGKVITVKAGATEINVKYTELDFSYDFAAEIEKMFSGQVFENTVPKYDEVKLEQLLRTFVDEVNREDENVSAGKLVYFDELSKDVVSNINLKAANATVEGIFKVEIAAATTVPATSASTAAPAEEAPAVEAPAEEAPAEEAPSNSDVLTVGASTTSYASSSSNRAHNVGLAASYLDGITLSPGETFSFNDYVGDTSYAKGYRDGIAYSDGEMVVEPGGGVCQVSTTLYQAVLDAGLKVVERYNHGSVVHYADYGMDATVYYPYVDFQFRNNTNYPVTIYSSADGSNLSISIKGQPATVSPYTYGFGYEVQREIEAGYTTKVDPSLDPGEEEIDYYPLDGVTADIYRYTYKNGELVDTEYMYTDYYRPMQGVKLVGPSGSSTKPSATTPAATEADTTPDTTPDTSAATTTP